MKNRQIVLLVLGVFIIGTGAFFGGIKYQQSRRSSSYANMQFGNGQFGSRMGQNGQTPNRMRTGGQIMGEILDQDDKSITVKMLDGSSKIVLLSGSTSINKAAEATAADLKTGERVAVFGTQNSDGSVTAQSVQINPIARTIQPPSSR